MNSAIYTGTVHHHRPFGRQHAFAYKLCYFLIDLDELEQLNACSRLFRVNGAAWFSLRESDYAGAGDLAHALSDSLAAAGCGAGPWKFRLLTIPRIAGYAFNPISVVYCYAHGERPSAMIYQVNNTFGERINYVAPVSPFEARSRHRCDKDLFVSPFFELDGYYEFDVTPPAASCAFKIDYYAEGEHRLRAAFSGARREFNARELRTAALTYSTTTLKVIGGIHYEALKLWLKGFPLHRHTTARRRLSVGNEL